MPEDQGAAGGLASEARAGNLRALRDMVATRPDDAYKWLLVAADFGHEEAMEYIADLAECHDTFKYDDDGSARMMIHLDLAEAYFSGQEGLQTDLKLGVEHLERFLDGPHASLADAREQHLNGLAERLQGEAQRALEDCMAKQPFRAVKRRVQRMEQLHHLNVEGPMSPR